MTLPHDRSEASDASSRALDAALRDLHREVLTEPVPPTLLDTARRLAALQQQNTQSWQWTGMAAGLVLAFGVGWFTHGRLGTQAHEAATLAKGAVAHEFVRQASYAHAVYLPEQRHPVEVAASEQEHLVQWLSKRVGKPLKVPKLEAQGFELVGGRLLPGDAGARAQFMFQDKQGQRVTLYLGAIKQADPGADAKSTQFRFDSSGAVASFYWVDQGFGYALSGQVDNATLMALANTVYSQIN
jgi:anti-sigma factor RsiW